MYDITGKEDQYKAKDQIGRRVPTPVTSTLEDIVFRLFPAYKYPYVSLSISVIMILFAIWSVKELIKLREMKPCYTLQVAEQKRKLMERKPIIVGRFCFITYCRCL